MTTRSNCNSIWFTKDRCRSTVKRPATHTNQTDNNSIIHQKFINLYITWLRDTQVKVLSKGLKFTPQEEILLKYRKDIHNFAPKLRWTGYFANENDITFDEET